MNVYHFNIIALILIVIVSKIIFEPKKTDDIPSPVNIDGYAENIIIKKYTNQGLLKITIKANLLLHYPKQNKSVLSSPFITLHQANTTPWTISANKGESLDGIRQINLVDNVLIHQSASGKEITIKTAALTYFTKTNKIYTKKLITLTRLNYSVTSIGLNADLNKNKFILNKTYGVYNKI